MEEINAYYNPEKLGLEQVASIEYSSGSYEFDTRVVWRHKETGKLYTARDSGCSCPTPFEGCQSLEDLADFSASKIIEEAKEEARNSYYGGEPVSEFIEEIKKLN